MFSRKVTGKACVAARGASLEFMAGKDLPGVQALSKAPKPVEK